MEKCGSYHQNWLLGLDNVLFLDGNNEFENDKNLIDEWIKKILAFSNCGENKKIYCNIS